MTSHKHVVLGAAKKPGKPRNPGNGLAVAGEFTLPDVAQWKTMENKGDLSSADAALENTSLLLSIMRQFVMEVGPALKRQKRSTTSSVEPAALYAPWRVRFTIAVNTWMQESVLKQAEGGSSSLSAFWADCADSTKKSQMVERFMLEHSLKNPNLESQFRQQLGKKTSNKKLLVKEMMCILILKYPKIQQAVNDAQLDSCVNDILYHLSLFRSSKACWTRMGISSFHR